MAKGSGKQFKMDPSLEGYQRCVAYGDEATLVEEGTGKMMKSLGDDVDLYGNRHTMARKNPGMTGNQFNRKVY